MSVERTWRVRLSIARRLRAMEVLADHTDPAVRALVEALAGATTERGHHSLGLDWGKLRHAREVTYPVPPNSTNIAVANAAHGWARRHGLKIATRSTSRQVTVYVVAGREAPFA